MKTNNITQNEIIQTHEYSRDDEMKLFQSTEFGDLNVLMIDGKEYFPATQCAAILGYANTKDAVLRHCKGVVKRDLPTNGGIQAVNYIPEGDLYRLITRSKLPSAERFERWVFEEVLPTIHKHGAYMTPEVIEKTLLNPDFIIGLATALKDEQIKRQQAEHKVDSLETDNKLLTNEIVLLSDRQKTVHAVRLLANKLGASYGKVFGMLYTHLNNKYGILLKSRQSKAKKKASCIDFVKPNEWCQVQKSFVAMLEVNNIEPTQFFDEAQIIKSIA